MNILFPHDKIRKIQDDFVNDLVTALKSKKHILAHAPTGLGKSAAVLSTTIPFAVENNLTVFFLTSRHTQHEIAVETIRKIKEKHNPNIKVVDLIGKKHMCLQNVETLTSPQFTEYCRELVENRGCVYYNNLGNGNKLSLETRNLINSTKNKILNVNEIIEESKKCKLCPYEVNLLKAKEANVIIMDYYHIFSHSISSAFFKKTEKTLSESIIIVDEAHNLPGRMREHLSSKITLNVLERALKESEDYPESRKYLGMIKKRLESLSDELREEECLVKKPEFDFEDFDDILEILENTADSVRDIKKRSYIGSVAQFLQMWQGRDEGFARILSKTRMDNKLIVTLSYLCLDPSLSSTEVIDSAYCVICMSGTLTPLEMYSDLLGFKNPIMKIYENPFPSSNRLNLVIPKTSTKFTKRSMGMYQDIARECSSIVNTIPGNTIIFFPSYQLKEAIKIFFNNLCSKTTFEESKGISKYEKEELLENFKREKDKGSVLLAVIGGSFSEGINLPGDLLKGVVVVGLPLGKPDLETTELINYFDSKYSKGWDYAYIFPAMQKTMQAAGRCIRTENDKGVIVFLDERYSWNNYFKCFPPDYNINVTMLPLKRIGEFFKV
ncbi:ATP-dependent DNA helicase [Candidatus Woesearchaeota archaeon]|nr:ATP-dependent DNA helicase [Candidatus Woesearchaeota archaeon]